MNSMSVLHTFTAYLKLQIKAFLGMIPDMETGSNRKRPASVLVICLSRQGDLAHSLN